MLFTRRDWLLLAAAAATLRAATIPRPAPDLSINLPDGSKLPIAKFRGKLVPLVFVGTGCPHCHQVTQILNEIQKEYGPKGVQILMSAMDEKAPTLVTQFIQRFNPAFPMGWNPHTEVLEFLQVPVVAPGYVPKVAFIDPKGIIRSQYGGEEPFFKDTAKTFREELDRLLKMSAAPARRTRRKK